jgi:non-ribosomal peptide synthase protein (TIGR01720 family)
VELEEEATRELLQEVPEVYHTQINEVLLAGLAQALRQWSGGERHVIALEGHGREDLFAGVDVSRTVGWFTSVFPVELDTGGERDAGEVLKRIKEAVRGIPHRGIGYGVLRYLSAGRVSGVEELAEQEEPELAFNYLGQLDQDIAQTGLFRIAGEGIGNAYSEQGRRKYLLELNGRVIDGTMRFTWTYSNAIHERATIDALAQMFIRCLRELITHCLNSEGGFTLSDFPLLNATR